MSVCLNGSPCDPCTDKAGTENGWLDGICLNALALDSKPPTDRKQQKNQISHWSDWSVFLKLTLLVTAFGNGHVKFQMVAVIAVYSDTPPPPPPPRRVH